LNIRFHQEVISAESIKDQWEVQTQDNLYLTKNLVIAAGCNHEPVIPSWPGQDSFNGRVIHSADYKNGGSFKGKKGLEILGVRSRLTSGSKERKSAWLSETQ
jgi:indole-3-pyruvate monooxygenase